MVFGLLRSAALWLQCQGIDYWQNWLDPPAHHVRWIDAGLAAGEFRIAQSGDTVLGCVRVQYSDEMFWGSQPEPAAYLHSMTTAREYAGRGLGAKLIAAVEREGAAQGALWTRLDCGATVTGLRAYYVSLGFKPVGATSIDGERLVLYQRAMADR